MLHSIFILDQNLVFYVNLHSAADCLFFQRRKRFRRGVSIGDRSEGLLSPFFMRISRSADTEQGSVKTCTIWIIQDSSEK